MTEVKLAPQLTCLRCGHVWRPNRSPVVVCAKCHSPYWDIPRRLQVADAAKVQGLEETGTQEEADSVRQDF